MAFQGTGINTNPNSNYFAFLARKPNEGKIPNVSEMITGSEHIYVIDSRERNKIHYPNPGSYSIEFNHQFKNVTSIELKGSLIPKTEYNVNSENMFIPFNVQDFITSIQIKEPGYGYIDGTYGFGAPPPNDTLISISPPAITGGTNALINVTVSGSSITNITIINPGSGYLRGYYGGLENPSQGFYLNAQANFINNIPRDNSLKKRFKQAVIKINIGNELIAILRRGQYDFAHPNDSLPGLCAEVTLALQNSIDKAISDGKITPIPGGPQNGSQYFPISALDSNDGSCFLFTSNPNASPNSRVSIQRGADDGTYTQDLFLELLWAAEDFEDSNSSRLLGYGTNTNTNKYLVTMPSAPLDQTSGTTTAPPAIWTSTPISGRNDYTLTDTPKYCILTFGEYGNEADRIESTNETLDKGFATLVFDANTADVVFREPEAITPPPGTGTSNWGSLLFKPGMLKAIKGADFDPKVLSFGPAPLAELNGLSISFKKYNGDLYDFHGKEHMLVFQISANDVNTGNKW